MSHWLTNLRHSASISHVAWCELTGLGIPTEYTMQRFRRFREAVEELSKLDDRQLEAVATRGEPDAAKLLEIARNLAAACTDFTGGMRACGACGESVLGHADDCPVRLLADLTRAAP